MSKSELDTTVDARRRTIQLVEYTYSIYRYYTHSDVLSFTHHLRHIVDFI